MAESEFDVVYDFIQKNLRWVSLMTFQEFIPNISLAEAGEMIKNLSFTTSQWLELW